MAYDAKGQQDCRGAELPNVRASSCSQNKPTKHLKREGSA